MLEAFAAFLNKIDWEGYAQEFREDNPSAFYSQFREFKTNQELPI